MSKLHLTRLRKRKPLSARPKEKYPLVEFCSIGGVRYTGRIIKREGNIVTVVDANEEMFSRRLPVPDGTIIACIWIKPMRF